MELTVIIQSKIYEIRGQQVMLDRDLADLYGVETKVLNQSVKRNIERFPDDFMFQLTNEETQNSIKMGLRRNPYAFTELGVAMLSSVLNSSIAIEVNIAIMRTFVATRRLISTPPTDRIGQLEEELKELKSYIEEVFTDYNDINEDTRMQLELINQTLAELQAQKRLADSTRNPIGFIKPKQ